MSILSHITIKLEYRTSDGQAKTCDLTPHDFFDIDPDTESASSLEELVWTHNHAIDYLDTTLDVIETSLEVQCSTSGEHTWEIERFWNEGRGRTIFRREALHGRELMWLRIVEIHTNEGIHFIRFGSSSKEKSNLISHEIVTSTEKLYTLFPGR